MGKLIAIDKLYMNKMPKSCKECPLTYLDTGDDAYFGSNERRCVIDDSCVDGMASERAYDCPLIEAIPKAEYENRLTTDMATIKQLSNSVKTLQKANSEIAGAYDRLKADYENRLKADMVAMLEDLDLQIDELSFSDEEPINITQDYIDELRSWEYGKNGCKKLIQQKINSLKGE